MNDCVWTISSRKIRNVLMGVLVMLIFIPSNQLIANPILLKDIDQSGGSGATNFLLFKGSVYFTAFDYIHGGELWRSDPPFNDAEMIKDIYPGEASSKIDFLGIMGGTIFFRADTLGHARTLWKSDGTFEGTQMLKGRGSLNGPINWEEVSGKIESQSEYNQFKNFVFLNDTLYFIDDEKDTGWELWMTDGTQEGTALVKDINPGIGSSFPRYLIAFNNEIYFSAYTEINGYEFWKSDGTPDGTVLVKDIHEGKAGSSLPRFFVFKNNLFFPAWDNVAGKELWKSDGTAAGTIRVKDIFAGPEGSHLSFYDDADHIIFRDRLFFAASDSGAGLELWSTDGTEAGTVLVKDIRAGREGSVPDNFVILNNRLCFTAYDGVHGNELWTSDGTPEGTILLKDINGTEASSFGSKFSIHRWGDSLYFFADDRIHGNELWKSDGTVGGTTMVVDINGSDSDSIDRSFGEFIFFTESAFYFVANDGVCGQELWRSDGTKGGTTLVKDIDEGENGYFRLEKGSICESPGNQIIFGASDKVHGYEPWISDGTDNGTRLISDLTTASIMKWKGPSLFQEMNHLLYFFTSTPQQGFELWKSDGTNEGTSMVKNLQIDEKGNFSAKMAVVFNDLIYFVAENYSYHSQLWKSDGSEGGTQLLANLNHIAHPHKTIWSNTFAGSGEYIYFSAHDGVLGYELWRSDGTKDGTILVKDINGGDHTSDSGPDHLTDIKGILYFTADDGKNGRELWRSDGSIEGTKMVKDINPLKGSSISIGRLTEMDGILYFIADDGLHGDELWRSDGTMEGTRMVRDIQLGKGSGLSSERMPELMVSGGILYFSANNGDHNYELWRSDGTTEGTRIVKDISVEGLYDPDYKENELESFFPSNLTDVNGVLYFTAYESFYDKGLWKTDGTKEGTMLIKKMIPRRSRGYQYLFTHVNGVLYYREESKKEGLEFWKSDGTPSGTQMVSDLYENRKLSHPRNLKAFDDTLYFVADHPEYGTEVWKMDGNEGKDLTGDVKNDGGEKGCFIQTLFIGR